MATKFITTVRGKKQTTIERATGKEVDIEKIRESEKEQPANILEVSGKQQTYIKGGPTATTTLVPGSIKPEEEPIRLGGGIQGVSPFSKDQPIRLGGEQVNPLDTLLDVTIAKSPLLQALTSPITTAALATTLVVAGGASALFGAGVATAKAGSVSSALLTTATKAAYGSAVPSTLQYAYNAKSAVVATGILAKLGVSQKALLIGGAWASSVMMGLWGTAESPESLAIPETKFAIEEAMRTGDWSTVDEIEAAKAEILDLKLWEKIALWSPISAFIGIPKKIKGAALGAKVTAKIIADLKLAEPEDEKWKRIKQEQIDSEKGMIDFYNDERKKMVEWEREAKVDGRDEDARFWRKERAKQDKLEKQSTEENAKFWTDYRKQTIELDEEAAVRSAEFWLDYQRKKQEIIPEFGGGAGAATTPGAPTPTGEPEGEVTLIEKRTGKRWVGPSRLAFGLLQGGGYYTEEEEKKKK